MTSDFEITSTLGLRLINRDEPKTHIDIAIDEIYDTMHAMEFTTFQKTNKIIKILNNDFLNHLSKIQMELIQRCIYNRDGGCDSEECLKDIKFILLLSELKDLEISYID